jgi:hypothetical protein
MTGESMAAACCFPHNFLNLSLDEMHQFMPPSLTDPEPNQRARSLAASRGAAAWSESPPVSAFSAVTRSKS